MTSSASAIPYAPHDFTSADDLASELRLVELLRVSGFPEFAHRRLEALVAKAPGSAAAAVQGAEEQRDSIDQWLSAQHGGAATTFIPSATLGTDGIPRFVVAMPRAASATLIHCAISELSREGADSELRNFLDEILIEQMGFIDFDPRMGFAVLTAATAPVHATSVYAVCELANKAAALESSIAASNVIERVRIVRNVNRNVTVDSLLRDETGDAGEMVVHAGAACEVHGVVAGAASSLRLGRVAAFTWRCAPRVGGELMSDDECSQHHESALAALAAVGFVNFALASRDDDVELVPLASVTGNTLVVSLSPQYIARAGVA